MSGSNLLFIVTGSIAGYKACEAISRLVQRGHRVRPVLTESAKRFVGEATLEGLTGERVRSDLFAPGLALEHIELTRWADAVVVCPATAHSLNRFAAGMGDDLAGALFLAHDWRKPFIVVPAMNPAMWAHPATVASVKRLQEWGVKCVPVGAGRTACGEIGAGRLPEPDDVVAAVEAALKRKTGRLKVLVTSGGTAEPIDSVRVLSNTSTGATGAGIASFFARCGHDVVLLRAAPSKHAEGCREETFGSFSDLEAALNRLLSVEDFDAVIHTAAVSDFGVAAIVVNDSEQPVGSAKLDSDSEPLLRLRRHPKLVDQLRWVSRSKDLRVVAFKLTVGSDVAQSQREVAALIEHSHADWVVHNDLSERTDSENFPADVYGPDGEIAASCKTRQDLATALEDLLSSSKTAPLQPS